MSVLRDQVTEFHKAIGQPIAESPTYIPDARVRLRAALIAEEFFETMESMFDDEHLRLLKGEVLDVLRVASVAVDMPGLADGMADLDYVVEGTRLEFGIDGEPIAAAVHAANMRKVGGPISPQGKRLKPPGWTPPDIAGELVKQGWQP